MAFHTERDHSLIIGETGELSVQIPSAEMTWQKVLQAARLVNAQDRGWKSITFWWSRGMGSLFESTESGLRPRATLVEQWTQNSLDLPTLPPARTDFKHLDERIAKLRGQASRTEVDGENKLNWEISRSLDQFLGKSWVVAYELFLVQQKAFQLKADIVAFSPEGHLHIIELKKDPPGDSPLMAAVELLCYLCQLLRSREPLLRKIGHQVQIENYSIQQVTLHVAAPNGWEKRWWERGGSAQDFEHAMQRLASHLAQTILGKRYGIGQISFAFQTQQELLDSFREKAKPAL
ncbi:MAG: hypothetical protein SFV32_07110 [Opitutaceae bacterium]|nr:hypothetical protein [Opitutaceae bacterium]